MNPPEIPILRERGFQEQLPAIDGNPTHEDLGRAVLVVAAATSAFVTDRKDAHPPLQESELGRLQAYTAEMASKIQVREATLEPQPGTNEAVLTMIREMREEMREMRAEMRAEMRDMKAVLTASDANILTRLTTAETNLGTRLTTAETNLGTQLTDLQKTVTEAKEEFETFRTSFGLWSRPLAQRYNKESVPGTAFQVVPYPTGEFPDEEIMKHLSSRNSINALEMPILIEICKSYDIRYPRLRATRNEAKIQKQIINYLCGLPYRVEDVEGDN